MYWNEITIETTPDKIEEASDFFYDNDIYSLNIEDPSDITEHQKTIKWDYIDEELLGKDMTKAFIKVYTEDDKEAKNLYDKGKKQGFNIFRKKIKAEDWENGWKKYYKTFNITDNLIITPAWEDYDKKDDEKVIILDSGMAFGTGTHETTRLCTEYIEKYTSCNKKVLDIGTGSGILAIASTLFGATDVTAIDIDELAVKVAKENVELNEKEKYIKVFKGDLLKTVMGKYDIIIANIVADIIKELIPNIKNYLNDGGIFIVSGIIKEREEEVLLFAKENGLKIIENTTMGGWSAAVLQ